MQLVATVAAERFEQVTGEARGMEPDEGRGGRVDVADHEDQRRLGFVFHPVGDDLADTILRRQVGFGHAIDQLLADAAISDQLLDRDDFQAVLLGQRQQLVAVGPIPG